MRGQQLTRLISSLRAELGRSTNVSVGVDDAPALIEVLQRTQETLYDDYDWPHLRVVFDPITLQAGQRFYEFPDGLNFDRIEEVARRNSGAIVPLDRGIGFDQYRAFDSAEDVRAAPVMRWDVRSDLETGKEQLEVWPLPADESDAIQFVGIRKLRPLVDSSDTTDLDDRLIVLFAAAELHPDEKKADIKRAAAQQLYARLKGRSKGGSSDVRLGMGTPKKFPGVTVSVSGR